MAAPQKWNKNARAVKATQVAFELEQKVARKIHEMAAKDGLTPSSQIRKLVGLTYSPPKRPRLTISLSAEDYLTLGEKYEVDPEDRLEIKRRIIEELIQTLEPTIDD
ncbi:hypothetical protein [Vibrio splendidus]|uniref:hypothetical protein n=1 Tax=Vibrio splendidus TaxID=29497 RepID=UPI000C852A01|nr:hypothetical protein [Vibrio splendidus]PMM11205.1 hypothetical protein BCT62_01875 [Vibrio splendidus]PMN31031.1 hypothetical protein BCT36_06530 [Vibrio splendidus]